MFSCAKEDSQSIPSYINIQEIILDENSTEKITDAWIYIDDQLQGIYELPANFPLLINGNHKLRVKAGIKDNGIAGTRIPYPFYSSYIIDNQEFTPKMELLINPVVSYLESTITDQNPENFDGNGLNLVVDTLTFSINNEYPIDGNYGIIKLTDSIYTSEVVTNEFFDLPQAGAPVYLELDYRSDTRFLIGAYANFPQTVLQKDLLWINPKEDWNKIYVNLTTLVSESIGVDFFKIFIKIQRDFSLDSNNIYFDNIKLVY